MTDQRHPTQFWWSIQRMQFFENSLHSRFVLIGVVGLLFGLFGLWCHFFWEFHITFFIENNTISSRLTPFADQPPGRFSKETAIDIWMSLVLRHWIGLNKWGDSTHTSSKIQVKMQVQLTIIADVAMCECNWLKWPTRPCQLDRTYWTQCSSMNDALIQYFQSL